MSEKLPLKMRRKDRQITQITDIEAIIKKADVCRIAFADNNTPYMVAMNFGYVRGNPSRLYFHCANTGRKIDLIRKNNYVCFQMDTDHVLVPGEIACDYTMTFQSVVGYGRIHILTENEEKIVGLNLLMGQYTEKDEWTYEESMLKRTTVLRLDIETLTAKRKDDLS